MDQHLDVTAFNEGDTVEGFYLVKEKTMRQTRQGKDYLDLEIMDRTGSICAKIWDDAEDIHETFGAGDIIKIRARVGAYNDRLDLTIKKVRASISDDELKVADFMPTTPYDIDELFESMLAILSTIEHPDLKALIDSYLENDEFCATFKQCTASKKIHHAYCGGLLEHTCSVVTILEFFSKHYDGIDRDILLTGGFLHDLGKMKELSHGADMSYTTPGTLNGHMYLGAEMVRKQIESMDSFPDALATEIIHMILSHQGELEWGSPVVPMTREALLIHFADNLDAKQFVALRALQGMRDDDEFSSRIYPLNRSFYRRENPDA